MKVQALILAVFIFLFSCKRNSKDTGLFTKHSFVGEYSDRHDGEAGLKITKTKGQHFVQILEDGEWSDTLRMFPTTQEINSELFGERATDFVLDGIYNDDGIALFHVDSQLEIDGERYPSDYLLWFLIASQELYKIK